MNQTNEDGDNNNGSSTSVNEQLDGVNHVRVETTTDPVSHNGNATVTTTAASAVSATAGNTDGSTLHIRRRGIFNIGPLLRQRDLHRGNDHIYGHAHGHGHSHSHVHGHIHNDDHHHHHHHHHHHGHVSDHVHDEHHHSHRHASGHVHDDHHHHHSHAPGHVHDEHLHSHAAGHVVHDDHAAGHVVHDDHAAGHVVHDDHAAGHVHDDHHNVPGHVHGEHDHEQQPGDDCSDADIVQHHLSIIRNDNAYLLAEVAARRAREAAQQQYAQSNANRPDIPVLVEKIIQSNAEGADNPDNNKCIICLDQVVRPAYCSHCGQKFCHQCILRWTTVKNTCPHCIAIMGVIIYNIESRAVYQVHDVPEPPRPIGCERRHIHVILEATSENEVTLHHVAVVAAADNHILNHHMHHHRGTHHFISHYYHIDTIGDGADGAGGGSNPPAAAATAAGDSRSAAATAANDGGNPPPNFASINDMAEGTGANNNRLYNAIEAVEFALRIVADRMHRRWREAVGNPSDGSAAGSSAIEIGGQSSNVVVSNNLPHPESADNAAMISQLASSLRNDSLGVDFSMAGGGGGGGGQTAAAAAAAAANSASFAPPLIPCPLLLHTSDQQPIIQDDNDGVLEITHAGSGMAVVQQLDGTGETMTVPAPVPEVFDADEMAEMEYDFLRAAD